jgi:RIO kinase 2
MVSTAHLNAAHFFERDVECLKRFFVRKYDFRPAEAGFPEATLESVVGAGAAAGAPHVGLDAALRASGFGAREREEFDAATEGLLGGKGSDDSDAASSDGEGEEEAEGSSDDEEEEESGDEAEQSGSGSESGSEPDADAAAAEEPPARSKPPAAPAAPQVAAAAPAAEAAAAEASPASSAGAANSGAESSEEDDTRSVAPSVSASASVGLSAREQAVRERLRQEKRRAGGASAAAGAHRKPNYAKDKSGSRKKNAKVGARDAVWG